MKPGATLVNVARGSLVDETALLDALRSGHIAAVSLDVLHQEPAVPSNPLLDEPSALVTPHAAGFTDRMAQGTIALVSDILQHLAACRRFPSLRNTPPSPRLVLS